MQSVLSLSSFLQTLYVLCISHIVLFNKPLLQVDREGAEELSNKQTSQPALDSLSASELWIKVTGAKLCFGLPRSVLSSALSTGQLLFVPPGEELIWLFCRDMYNCLAFHSVTRTLEIYIK